MLKINYPLNSSQDKSLSKFNEDYKSIFKNDIDNIQMQFDAICIDRFQVLSTFKIEDILTMDFEELFRVSQIFKSLKPSPDEKLRFRKVFNYDSSFEGEKITKYQPRISSFFVRNSKLLGIKTCFFCNLEYINTFSDIADYLDFEDFINNSPLENLTDLKGLGPSFQEEIKKLRNKNKKYLTIGFLRKNLPKALTRNISRLENMQFEDNKYYFTLDHVLDKAENPMAALSIYNFVPCCSSCNSKFKTIKELVKNKNQTHLSPTSDSFKYDEDNKFNIYFKCNSVEPAYLIDENDFSVRLSHSSCIRQSDYEHYERIFKLNSRYKGHKLDLLNLYNKKIRYPKSKIEEIASMFNLVEHDVKEDIFGKEIKAKCKHEKTKAKFLSDIAEQLKII